MAFCLPKFAAEKFLKGLPEDLSKLTDVTSEERRSYFKDLVGEENARQVNALFESKLLLKNQQAGIIRWAKSVSGLKPEAQRNILTKVNNMTEILNPKDKAMFLEDLAAHKLGMGVTVEEAGRIADLAKRVSEAKAVADKGGERLPYGQAKVAFGKYVSDLRNEAAKTTFGEKLKMPFQTATNAAGTIKAIKASLDNSAIFRQGWKAMLTNPSIWGENAWKSFSNIARTLGGKEVMDEVNAEIASRPTYDAMVKAKLAIGKPEEAFPTSLPEKIPLFGRLYKASETGFTAFLYKVRADIFDKYLTTAKNMGIDITDKAQLQDIGKLVNSLTGRGDLGRGEAVARTVNNIFFSPRFLKSQFDVLTAHQFQKGVTPFVRRQAAVNLVKIVTGTAAIMAIANAVQPGSAELDPRSSDFGKIRIGDTRFDITGGAASLVTLIARELTQSSKSTTSGKVQPLNSGKFGAATGVDVLVNFAENKLSPAASVVRDIMKGETFQGEKPTLTNEANNLITPLPVQNFFQSKDNDHAANILLIMLADALGISANTYSPPKKR